MTATATVSIPYSEFQEIQDKRKEAELEAAKLKEQITQAKIAASDPHLLALSRAALEVVRYAVASMPPESNPGWPYEALRVVAAEVVNMPDATPDHSDLATTFKIFATECEQHEERRRFKARPIPKTFDGHEIVAHDAQDP